jgi:hypothetical protein
MRFQLPITKETQNKSYTREKGEEQGSQHFPSVDHRIKA